MNVELIKREAGASRITGDEFARLRRQAGLTQGECADVFGMPQSSISRIETKGLKRGGQTYRLAFRTIINTKEANGGTDVKANG